MSKSQKDLNIVTHTTELNPKLLTDVRKSIVVIRDIPVIADADVASLYGGIGVSKEGIIVRSNRGYMRSLLLHRHDNDQVYIEKMQATIPSIDIRKTCDLGKSIAGKLLRLSN